MLTQTAYLFVSKVFGFGIRVLLPYFLVRLLSVQEIGAYNQFFLMDVLVTTLFQMGVNQSLYYFIPRDPDNSGAYFLNSLMLNVFLYSVAFTLIGVFRVPIADKLGMPLLLDYFWYLATYSVIAMLNVCAESYLMAKQRTIFAAGFTVISQILASVATLIAAFWYKDLGMILLLLIVSRALTLLAVLLFIHLRFHGFRSRQYFFGIRDQVRYGIVLGLAGTVWVVMMRTHELAVSSLYDIETFAVYSNGCKRIPVLMLLGQSVSAVALVQFAKLEKDNDWAGIKALWDRILGTMYGIGIPVTIFFVAIAEPFIHFMYTEEYWGAVPIFQINNLAIMYLMLNPTLVLRAMGRNDITLKVHLGTLALVLPAIYIGNEVGGTIGIITAHALVMNGGRITTQFLLNRLAPVHLSYIAPWKEFVRFYVDGFRKLQSRIKPA